MEVPEYDEENPIDAAGFDEIMHDGNEIIVDDTDMFNSNEMESDDDKHSKGDKTFKPITVDRATIDLDSIVQSFKSNALIIRLNYIAETCPPLRADAFRALIDYLRNQSQNTTMYSTVYQKIEFYKASGAFRGDETFPSLDQDWLDQASQRANNRLDALNSELRRQKDDGVKESIRRAMNDVFNQHLAMGNVEEALKLYSRGIREYCINPNVLVEMLLNWITATVYAEQWSKLSILLPQAERAVSEILERDTHSASSQNTQRPAASSSNTKTARNIKELVAFSNAKIAAVTGLMKMKKGDYKEAAKKFISIEMENLNFQELLSPNDIALYGVINSLATKDRNEVKNEVLGSSEFRKFLETDPKLAELVTLFCRNQFGASFDILNDLRDQFLMNVYLAPQVADLYAQIRRRAIVQFFQPYMSVNMKVMANEFRTTVEELEDELVDLIRSGLLNARIDTHSQVVEAKVVDRRSQVFERALKANSSIDTVARSLLIRATLQEMKCIVGLDQNARRKRNMHEEEFGRGGPFGFFSGMEGGSISNRFLPQVVNYFRGGSGGSRND